MDASTLMLPWIRRAYFKGIDGHTYLNIDVKIYVEGELDMTYQVPCRFFVALPPMYVFLLTRLSIPVPCIFLLTRLSIFLPALRSPNKKTNIGTYSLES